MSLEKNIGKNVIRAAPKVSVIIPAFNVANFISETLDSVLAQTFQDYEIVLINDGSPDTEEFESILKPYLENIIYLKQENLGAGAARNVAIEHARGKLLAFLDGDDIWFPEFLESQVKFLEENDYDLVYADAYLFGGSALDGRRYMENAPSKGEANFESLLDLRCNVITSGTVARKDAVMNSGMFEWERVRAHDFHLWLRMTQRGSRIGYQKKALLKYRMHLDSLSGNSIQRVEREIDVYQRVTKMMDLNQIQKQIVERRIARSRADLEVERGKSFLLQKKFAAAQDAFAKANDFHHSNRLRAIIWLTRIAPRLLLKIYQSQRTNEIAFVPQNIK